MDMEKIKITMIKDGPMMIKGSFDLENSDGTEETKSKTTFLCRCGKSESKPYCDGAHKRTEFKG